MSLFPLIVLTAVITSSSIASDDPGEGCDVQSEQTRTIGQLATHVQSIEKKMVEKKRDRLGPVECEDVVKLTYYKYKDLGVVVYKNYRNYLNTFLEEASKDSHEVKIFKKFTDYLRNGEGLKAMQESAKYHSGAKKAFDGDYKQYEKLSHKAGLAEEKLENLMRSRYKTLRKNIGEKHREFKQEFLPTTDFECEYYEKANRQKIIDRLLNMTPALSIHENVCSENAYDYYPHPKEQRVVNFQVREGRAMVWYCKQNFESKQMPPKQRGNYGPYSETMVTSTAGCLAYDLLNDRFMLGDFKQRHASYEVNPYINVNDARLELAKGLGKTPLTYEEFIKQNPSLLPEAPEKFFPKVIPKECHFWSFYKETIIEAQKVVLNAEKPRYTNHDIEY